MEKLERGWCPTCGGTAFVRGAVADELRCFKCREVGRPAYFSGAVPELSCKSPACGARVARKHWHLVTSFADFRERLREGYIRCPQCKGRHRALNVTIVTNSLGVESFFGQFGEYDPEAADKSRGDRI